MGNVTPLTILLLKPLQRNDINTRMEIVKPDTEIKRHSEWHVYIYTIFFNYHWLFNIMSLNCVLHLLYLENSKIPSP